MAVFGIRHLAGAITEYGGAVGEIQIGDFVERFSMVTTDRSVAAYVDQWRRSAAQMVGGAPRGGFVTSALAPTDPDGRVHWWVYYREGGSLIFQEHMLLMSRVDGPFDVDAPDRWVPPHEAVSDDGDRVSEWRIAVDGLVVQVGAGS